MRQKDPQTIVDSAEEFPGLKELGITRPSQISRYSLREEGGEDVLRIYYKRAKGSLLPSSRKYVFGRSHKTIITDSGKPEYALDPQISTILQQVTSELDNIVKHANDNEVLKASLIDDIEHLDRYVSSRIRELRTRIEQM